jgi:uncharacterized protein YjbJ (UPF0337 family)
MLANPGEWRFRKLEAIIVRRQPRYFQKAGTSEWLVSWTISTSEEMTMDWNRVEGNWKQFMGSAKEKWGKLTDDDLNVIEGRRDQLEGKLQQRYGFAKDQIRKDVDDWFSTLK